MTAGYSGTPLARKLGLGTGTRLLLVSPPPDIDELLAPLPADVAVRRRGTAAADWSGLRVVHRLENR